MADPTPNGENGRFDPAVLQPMEQPRNPAAHLRPGQSGNPHGRGKTAFQKLAEELAVTLRSKDGSEEQVSVLKAVCLKLLDIFLDDNADVDLRMFAVEQILKYGSSLPVQQTEIAGQVERPIPEDRVKLIERLIFLRDFIARNGGLERVLEIEVAERSERIHADGEQTKP
jgi:hypothetical protein